MALLTYYVRETGDGWTVSNDGKTFTGYSSEAAAITSATNVALKLSLNGHQAQVVLESSDGSRKAVWSSDNAPPSIESMIDA